ncbi:MAG: bifunctional 5,10-methylenetetrahydrofolate dehydrogenase/5,10-methenyltetrahydrofolate cyclohydrolase, partial [Phycisphaerales bacterium]|nr:bifunctional 5,10-methylenetetrahydrofolate dehydrogenase/5,10-methenyltetrahydrofolate cyclohydrolase [Phycisphaerales bacterium]
RESGRTVRLDAILAAGKKDAASRVYAENQAKMCEDLAIEYHLHELSDTPTFDDIARCIRARNEDPDVHAIMLHLPLPAGIDTYRAQSLIDPEKDVEGVNPANIGNIVYGRSSLAPCTALAAIRMVEHTRIDLKGKIAVCVGASNIVGKPVAVMLMRKEATVISCNEHTPDITDLTRRADVLITAAGVPGLVKADWVKPGAIVID